MTFIQSLGIIIGITFLYSTPLIYASLGGVFSETTGVVNIGLEGIMTIGALVGATVGYYAGNPWLAFFAGGLAGLLLSLLHAITCIEFQANHVISGTAINFIGPGLAIFISRLFFDGAAQTLPISFENKMPRPFNNVFTQGSFFDNVFNQYITVYLALILVMIVWFVLNKTKIGLRMRAVGEHPRAADTLGINVKAIKYLGVLLSGFFAGLGGASMSLAIVSNFRVTLISGHGFIALAAMIFGKWRPQGALGACLIFGITSSLIDFMGITQIKIPSELLAMLPYILTLVVLVAVVGESNGPKSNGLPYSKNEA